MNIHTLDRHSYTVPVSFSDESFLVNVLFLVAGEDVFLVSPNFLTVSATLLQRINRYH